MFYVEFVLQIQTLTQEEDWISCEPPWQTDTIPTLYSIGTYLPEWLPFLPYMKVSIESIHANYIVKMYCTHKKVFEVTHYKDKQIVSLPKWDTLTYGDLIRVLSRMFRIPVRLKPFVHDSSYVIECTRTMFYRDQELILM